MREDIPKEVRAVVGLLEQHGFSTYLAGGCVRDLLLGRPPKDWDVATSALPEKVQEIFSGMGEYSQSGTVYENEFGTVGVKTGSDDPTRALVEVTTFRIEGRYTDKRHPDGVRFARTVEEDLSRRDFTINAMAMQLDGTVVDPYGGEKDLAAGIVRTVGDPVDRFTEDALRLMRAVRFATELDFRIDIDTRRAIERHAELLALIANERIRDELVKMVMTPRAAAGVILLEELGLLRHILPELREGLGVGQNKHHIYTVFEHNVRSLEYAAKQDYGLVVRLASLLHDVGKPKTKGGDGPNSTFYGHDRVGARMAARALERLRFSGEVIDAVAHLIRYHMFYYNVGEVSDAGVRRFIRRVGPETIPDLIKVREADRIGSGVPKAVPYKLRHFLFMIEKVKHDPISPKMVKMNGEDVMRILGVPPSPRVGRVLAILLEDVLDDPSRNMVDVLESRVRELGAMTDQELAVLSKKAKETKDAVVDDLEAGMKMKYRVG